MTLPLGAEDVGELLTLQRAAYVTEAQLYNDVRLPALVQTLAELAAEIAFGSCLGVRIAGRLVGAVRTREQDETLHVARLVVAPDLQGRGLGSRLIAAAEATTRLPRAALFTGHRSAANLRLYERLGYTQERCEPVRDGLVLVHLGKGLGTSGADSLSWTCPR